MSRVSVLAVVVSLLAVGCSKDSTPTTPSGPANKFVFTATLLPGNEVPPVTNADSTGRGQATMTMNTTRDASGNITAASVDFLATTTGFPPGTIVTSAHIHEGAPTCACPVVINTLIGQGEVTMPNGSGSLVHTNPTVSPVDIANRLISNPSAFYFNIHTQLNPGGAVRGQLALQP
jgi:hypothetical protein